MRLGRINKQRLFYALQGAQIPIYERNSDGTIKYITIDNTLVPVETGDYEIGYEMPVEFYANISTSGEANVNEYGLSISDYDAVVVAPYGYLPITETSLIWHKGDIGYKDINHTIVDPNTADYRVVAVKDSLNVSKYVLKRITK